MRFEAIPQVSNVFTRPAPVKGINAYDAIIAMPEGFALILRNLFAQPYGVQVRHGYVRHAVGLEGDVETVMSHNTTDTKLYAFSTGSSAPPPARGPADAILYDVTTANAAPVEVKTLLSNARWQHINFPNEAGVHLLAVNGADDMIWIAPDGTLTDITAGDGATNTISGVDPKNCIHIYSHQRRVWLTEKDSTSGWYLPPNVLFGVAKQFDFGPNWTRGGYLTQIITWTIDDGNGADDHLAAISSEGEVSIYQGTDPDNADTWALQGVYYAGAPTGRRAACRYGGDIAIVTQFGLVMLSDLLKSTKVNPADEGRGKYIQQLVSSAVTATGDLFGWQPFLYPGDNQFYINVPTTRDLSFQFVMNDITKAWSEFIGYQAHCWELHQQRPFFGGFGGVYRAWEGFTDDAIVASDGTITPGTAIRAEAQTAYTNFGQQVINKHFKMVRPSLLSAGRFNVNIACNVDFSFQSALSPVSFDSYQPGRWDEDYWDSARWAGGLIAFNEWITVLGIGFVASLRILTTSTSETYWASSDWLFENGGVM